MGERFVITGVQLGMLKGSCTDVHMRECLDEILLKQHIGHSDDEVSCDVKVLQPLFIKIKKSLCVHQPDKESECGVQQ